MNVHWHTYRVINDERIRALQKEARQDRLARDLARMQPRKDGTVLRRAGSLLRIPLLRAASALKRAPVAREAAATGETYRR